MEPWTDLLKSPRNNPLNPLIAAKSTAEPYYEEVGITGQVAILTEGARENMRCANCWEEILQPPPNSTELEIHWIFDGSVVCPACHSILRELKLAE